jgi:hypothetical protein
MGSFHNNREISLLFRDPSGRTGAAILVTDLMPILLGLSLGTCS